MKRIERLRLDINKEDSFNIVNFKQNDTCDLIIDIYKDGIVQDVSNQIINFYVKKPDNTFVEQTTGISATGNVVTINVDEQVVTREGRAYGEITLRDDNGKMTSSCFIINVGEQKVNINDLIESSDKIAILDEIRDFIEQSRRDIEEYKATIRDLDERVAENDAKINGLNEKIEEIDINIDEVKEQALTEIDNKHREVVETISNANEALREAKEQALTDINAEKDNALNTVEEKQTEAVEAIESTKNESVEEINAIKTELQDLNRVAQNTKVQLKAEHTTAENRREALQEVVDSANAINELLLSTKEEASNKEIDLSELINTVNTLIRTADSVIESLRLENIHAEENMNELNPLNVEADENIEELKRLIQQAIDIAIPALKAYIAEHTPAEDLTEVNQQLEELFNAVQELDIRFNNYYTKEETDALISEKINEIDLSDYYNKKEVDNLTNPYKGAIGEDPHPIEFKSAPPMTEDEHHYVRCLSYNGKYRVHYIKKESITLKSGNLVDYCQLWGMGSGNRTFFYNTSTEEWELVPNETYIRVYTKNTDNLSDNVYSSSINLYNKAGTEIIVCAKPGDPATAPLNTYNTDEAGEYKVSHIEAIEGCYKDNFEGLLVVKNVNSDIYQELTSSDNSVKVIRTRINNEWTEWKEIGGASDIDLSDFYNKTETDNKIDEKISAIQIPEIPEIPEVDLSDYYNKQEINEIVKEATGKVEDKESTYFHTAGGEYEGVDFVELLEAQGTSINDITGIMAMKLADISYVVFFTNNEEQKVYYRTASGKNFYSISATTSNKVIFRYYDNVWSKVGINVFSTSSNLYYIVETYYHDFDIADSNGNIVRNDYNKVERYSVNDFNLAIDINKYEFIQDKAVLNSPVEGACKGILVVDKANEVIKQELITENDTVYRRTFINNEWSEWIDAGQVDLSNYYNKTEIDAKLVKEIGVIKSGDPNFKEPKWDELPTNTFINIPANPDPSTYKWEMKCSHYNYHMVFYFPIDPTGKFGIVKRSDGKLGFKLLDNSFKYTTYTSYYKAKDSSTKWSAMPSDNHFLYPDKRELEAMYSHNFDIVDGNNPDKIFRYGSQNDFGAEFIKDFNEATELEVYTVNATEEGVIENSPIVGAYKGVLKVFNVNNMVHQTLETTKGESCKRLCVGGKWTEWSRESQFDIEPNQYSERNGNYTTNSLIELYNGNLRFEYGEYIVDSAKNSQHVENPTKEYTDLIMLKAGGFKQVLGCMVFPHKLDFHYSMYCNINMVLVDPSNKPDCMRLYIGYLGDRTEAFHPVNGLVKIKYCVFGY